MWMNCRLVWSPRSQFFHSLRCFSSHAKLRSTTQRLGRTMMNHLALSHGLHDTHWSRSSILHLAKLRNASTTLSAKLAVRSSGVC